MSSILHLENIQKTYGTYKAVDNVSFDMPKGSIFGLLGPNGAGKTSLIRIITTITRPDHGKVFINGELLNSEHPHVIGYLPEERGLYRKMKVGPHLMYLAQLKGMSNDKAKKAISHWFEKFEITDWWDKKVDELSKGMQQKIQFISTVLHEPDLLILDEPFSGLDPINTNLIKDEIKRMHQDGKSIIFSTHRMEQVEEMCEYIVLINKGQKILEGPVKDIQDSYKENLFRIDADSDSLPEPPTSLGKIIVNDLKGITLQLDSSQDSNELLKFYINKGIKINGFREILPSLNEVFIKQVNGIMPVEV